MDRKRILIIEDEESFAQAVQANLEETGKYEVRIETEGARALLTIKVFNPDLILLDIIMPHVDGAEIASQIKSDENLKDIPFVFLTAMVEKGEAAFRRGIVGGNPVLAKPISKKELIECIEKNIKRRD